jgi:hypothetical protein
MELPGRKAASRDNIGMADNSLKRAPISDFCAYKGEVLLNLIVFCASYLPRALNSQSSYFKSQSGRATSVIREGKKAGVRFPRDAFDLPAWNRKRIVLCGKTANSAESRLLISLQQLQNCAKALIG